MISAIALFSFVDVHAPDGLTFVRYEMSIVELNKVNASLTVVNDEGETALGSVEKKDKSRAFRGEVVDCRF